MPNNKELATKELATLGGGCFWCLEAIYQDVIGVSKVTSGYAGGATENPSYEQVCSGRTGHAEVVQIEYDPAAISFDDLLTIFWRIHDPTTLNRQGNDVGTQYRSIILTHDQDQMTAAQRSLAEARGLYADPIVTQIEPLNRFYPAEVYHDDYYRRNRNQPYCRAVIDPKVKKFRKTFADKIKQPA